MKAIIVIPTYNERDNIFNMLHALEKVRQSIKPYTIDVLVVDDNSPDGTQTVVKELQTDRPWIHLITGKKQGLGAAYIRGMTKALSLGVDVVFEMDADFSHDPNDIERFLQEVDKGHDFVIGSRYVPGGSIPEEWQFWRKLNSRAGNFVARTVAGMYSVRDCTAGFRAIKSSLLKKIDLTEIQTQGYGFQVSLLHEAYINSANIKEIPVRFIDRTAGESKLGLSDIIEFILNAFAIRLRSSKTLIRFLVVGFSGVFVNLGLFWLFQSLSLSKFLASPLAIEGSIIWNFFLNNFWTFGERKTKRGMVTKGVKFNIISIGSLAISYTTFLILTWFFPEGPTYLFQAAGILPASLINYFCNSYWTFKGPEETTT